MDNKKDDKYYVNKIIEDIEIILKNTESMKQNDLIINSPLCDSILFRIIQISESSTGISSELKDKYKNIPWRSIKNMRNKIVHEYGSVDLGVVYSTVKADIPHLYLSLKNIVFK